MLEPLVISEHRIYILDTQLFIHRNVDVLDLLLLEQVLLSLDHLLQEVFVEDAVIRQVELDYRGVKNMGRGTHGVRTSIGSGPICF